MNGYPITSYICPGCDFTGQAKKRFITCGGCGVSIKVCPSENPGMRVTAQVRRRKKKIAHKIP